MSDFAFRFQALYKSFHMAPKRNLCPYCGAIYTSRSGLRKHICKKHKDLGLKYQCETCSKAFAEKHQLKAHRVQHGDKGIECGVCKKQFTTSFSMRRHRAGVHENIKHRCVNCNAVFNDRSVLNEHIKGFHQQQYRFVCSNKFCGARFRWGASLSRHMKAKHPEEM